MNLDSKFFDRIRVKPRHRDPDHPQTPHCAWEGCKEPGIYRAPKGNRAEGQYHNFCLEHVRHYNAAYNFFSGMDAAEVEEHVNRSTQTDGRPSWGLGAKPGGYNGPRMPNGKPRNPEARKFSDPLHIFARYARAQARNPQEPAARPMHEPDRRALETLGFDGRPRADEIKKAYKRLVKIHHPDANGGDKASEDRLRSIIAAYSHLKAKGFVTS
jgi:hypothetical protein